MDTLEKIVAKLANYPTAQFARTQNSITIAPATPEGFEVRLEQKRRGFTVWFDGWHEEFESEDAALNCLAFGLSSACRLRVDLRGSFPHRWTVESLHDGKWQPDSETGLLLFPFWLSARTEYRQNRLVSAA